MLRFARRAKRKRLCSQLWLQLQGRLITHEAAPQVASYLMLYALVSRDLVATALKRRSVGRSGTAPHAFMFYRRDAYGAVVGCGVNRTGGFLFGMQVG